MASWFIIYLAGNALTSLATGLVVVATASWVFRMERTRWKPWLLALPYAKAAWDAWFSFSPIPYALRPSGASVWDRGSMTLGGGVRFPLAPFLKFDIVAQLGDQEMPLRLGDVLLFWGRRHAPDLLDVAAFVLLAVGLVLMVRRIALAARFEIERRRLRRGSSAHSQGCQRIGRRSVDVYVSEAHRGSPFAGGCLSPYICFPAEIFARLNVAEFRSVLEHERAHLAEHHVELLFAAKLLADLLWFIPFAYYLVFRLEQACERVADARAIGGGAEPLSLASALVSVAEHQRAQGLSAKSGATALGPSALSERVRWLLGDMREPRHGFSHPVLRYLILMTIVQAVFVSQIAGG